MAEIDYEFQIKMGDKIYGMDSLISVHIKQPLFDKMDVGLACCAELTISYYLGKIGEPPRGSKVVLLYKPKGFNTPWFQFGVFYIDLRTTKSDKQTLICYDSMMLADTPFIKDGNDVGEWPRNMKKLASDIADRMGIEIDPRTEIVEEYEMDFPNDTHMRILLQYIAAAHAGNWIITSSNRLLLVPLATSMPPETHYLIEEHGRAILFGKDRILV